MSEQGWILRSQRWPPKPEKRHLFIRGNVLINANIYYYHNLLSFTQVKTRAKCFGHTVPGGQSHRTRDPGDLEGGGPPTWMIRRIPMSEARCWFLMDETRQIPPFWQGWESQRVWRQYRPEIDTKNPISISMRFNVWCIRRRWHSTTAIDQWMRKWELEKPVIFMGKGKTEFYSALAVTWLIGLFIPSSW